MMSGAGTPVHTPLGTPHKLQLSAASHHIPDDVIEKYKMIGELFQLQVKALKVIMFVYYVFPLILHFLQSMVIGVWTDICVFY